MAKPAILIGPRFQSALKNLSGISIRRLKKNVFECRAGLKVRLLFREKAGVLEFFFAGDHNEVRRLIRAL